MAVSLNLEKLCKNQYLYACAIFRCFRWRRFCPVFWAVRYALSGWHVWGIGFLVEDVRYSNLMFERGKADLFDDDEFSK